MAANPFRGLSISDLISIRDAALSEIKKAGSLVQGSVGGKSFTKDLKEVKERLRQTLEELRRLDPDTYGARVTRSSPSFI